MLALAHGRPLHAGPVPLANGGITQAGRDRQRPQHLQTCQRILERPQRIAGVEIHADVVFPGSLHELRDFARIHVASMVLDRDLHARVDRLRPARPQIFTVSAIWRLMPPSVSRSFHVPSTARMTGDPTPVSHANGQREMFLCGTPVRLERLRRGQMLHVPTWSCTPFSRARAFTPARYGASNDSKASRSEMNSESALMEAA